MYSTPYKVNIVNIGMHRDHSTGVSCKFHRLDLITSYGERSFGLVSLPQPQWNKLPVRINFRVLQG